MPFLSVIFIIGWIMYCTGGKQSNKAPKVAKAARKNVTIKKDIEMGILTEIPQQQVPN
jgi:hypothetical protein